MKELPKVYDPKQVESKIYDMWMRGGYFAGKADPDKKPFSIVMPPPNVTGQLHMGHALDATLQDILTRYKRMQGYAALWVPGTDHAGIATQIKVEEMLRKEEGLTRYDLGREEFLKRVWAWKKQYGNRIVEQQKSLGVSCDWDRSRFTMDDGCSKAVRETFCELYEKGLIYKGNRIINWCPHCRTALSDAEVEYKDMPGAFWYIRYPLKDSDDYLTIATTRPETMLGDTGIAVNPADERYQHLVGKTAILPLVGRELPIVADDYVELDFGTGCVKMTPCHDPNDYEVGLRHNLEQILIFDEDARVINGGKYNGLDRYEARKAILADLEEQGYLIKTEPYNHNVGTCYRCGTTVEPMTSPQWFVKMKPLAEPAIEAVRDGRIKFVPERFSKTYYNWMENVHDWCISRQLWWGHRIPAWYCPDCGELIVSREEPTACPKCGSQKIVQDPDTLDTWFSSALWPFSTLGWPDETPELKHYYPTNTLVTGYDIIFFWVARMIMAGYEYEGKMPFKNVYFTGIVRDKLGRKMSKSLGNSPDPLDLIDKYGADGVRVGMLLCAPAGGDLLFDESLPEQGRNFTTKMWNAFKLVKSWEVASIDQPAHSRLALEWFKHLLGKVNETLNTQFDQYRISEALMTVYTTFRDEFSSWLLEMIKPAYGQPIDRKTYEETLNIFEQLLQLLHPFMPFITEEIWQTLRERQDGESIMISRLPKATSYDESYLLRFEAVKNIIVGIRNIRKQNNIAFKDVLELKVKKNERYPASFDSIIRKMGNIGQIGLVNEPVKGAWSFIADTVEYFIPAQGEVNTAEVKAKLEEELNYTRGFLTSVMKKLSNEKFVNGAPEQVVANERKKQADAEVKIAAIEAQLKGL